MCARPIESRKIGCMNYYLHKIKFGAI